MVSPEDIQALHPSLRTILTKELANGNEIVETWRGWPAPGTVCVMLAQPFGEPHAPLPANVVFRTVDDRHYWKAEYEHEPSRHLLACRFGNALDTGT